jgi:O-antigen/teichoic acid export membrane protein
MVKVSALIAGSPNRRFVLTRGVSTALALLLALAYTKVLGVEKRSVLAFVMTASLIFTILLTSGISLTYRKNIQRKENEKELDAYLTLIFFLSIVVAIISTGLLALYAHIQTPIQLPLYIVAFVYSFFACMNFGFQDGLLAVGKLKLATIFDLATVLVQIITCFLLFEINKTSLIVSVFLAFILSYILITFATLSVISDSLDFQWRSLSVRMKSLVKSSRKNYLFGIANGLADRIDRLIIGLLLPIGYLAKYSLISSLIMYTRFLPDALSKLSLMSEHARAKLSSKMQGWRSFILAIVIALALAIGAQFFVFLVFGKEWLLPLWVPILFGVQEIFRGYYQINAARLIAHGEESKIALSSGLLIALSLVFITGATYVFGIIGAPTSMILVYWSLNLRINSKMGTR